MKRRCVVSLMAIAFQGGLYIFLRIRMYLRRMIMYIFSHMKHYYLHDSSVWVKLSLGMAAAAVLGFVLYKWVD